MSDPLTFQPPNCKKQEVKTERLRKHGVACAHAGSRAEREVSPTMSEGTVQNPGSYRFARQSNAIRDGFFMGTLQIGLSLPKLSGPRNNARSTVWL